MPEERKEVISSAETLLDEIEAFAKRVENGDYCDGWGWDEEIREELDWGDEGWADEMDELFLQARSLLLQGEYRLAEDAYTKLFDILEMGQEPGHLPGNPDYSTMLKVDLMEQVALFLRCIYMNAAPLERPACVYEAMNNYGYLTHELKLQSIINASDSVLPDLDGFLAEWIDFLTRQGGVHVSVWLREAVWLKGGIPAISAFARQSADQYPRAYMDWIEGLEKEADTEAVIAEATIKQRDLQWRWLKCWLAGNGNRKERALLKNTGANIPGTPHSGASLQHPCRHPIFTIQCQRSES